MVYILAIQIKHGYEPTLNTCTEKQGIIANETKANNRWTDNCQEMLNKNGDNINTQRLSENNKYLTAQCWIEYPTTEEVAGATLMLKNQKNPDKDAITAQFI